MQHVIAEGERTNTPVLILSGQFGLLSPDDPIPYYDHLLTEDELDEMVLIVTDQLEGAEATKITAYIKKGREVEGWAPYYELLERASLQAKVPIEYAKLGEPSEPRSETLILR